MIDLHLHSTKSDGKLSPKELVQWALLRGLKIISLTDHDSISGLDEAKEESEKIGIQLVPGIELSAYAKEEVHILGYNIDYKNAAFLEELSIVQEKRRSRNLEIKAKLESLGIMTDIDPAHEDAGRMNFARDIVSKGYCPTVNDVFDKYLGKGGAAYTVSMRLSPLEAVKLIENYGGTPVLAHPKRFIQDKSLELLVEGLVSYGLKGIEVYYPSHTEREKAELKALAKRHNLIMTGGSDFHGDELSKTLKFKLDDFCKKTLNIT